MIAAPAISPATTAVAMMTPVSPNAASATWIIPMSATGSLTSSMIVGVIGPEGGGGGCSREKITLLYVRS
jgi:hypothetical protein